MFEARNDSEKQAVKIPMFCWETCELMLFPFASTTFPHALCGGENEGKAEGRDSPPFLVREINHLKFENRETTEYLLHAKEFLACVNKQRANVCVRMSVQIICSESLLEKALNYSARDGE